MRQLTRGNFAPTSKQALELFGARHRIGRLLKKTDHVPQIPLGDGLLRTRKRVQNSNLYSHNSGPQRIVRESWIGISCSI